MASSDVPTLKYFPFGGRAAPIRAAFKLAKIEFHDVHIKQDEWPAHKANTPFGGIPVLEHHGKQISQSNSILRYVGKLGNLYPTDAFQALLVDEVIDAADDFSGIIAATLSIADPEKKKEKRDEITNTSGPKFFGQLEKVLERNGAKENVYVSGKTLTIGDIKLFYLVAWLKSGVIDHIPTTLTDSFPLITALYNAVKPQIPA